MDRRPPNQAPRFHHLGYDPGPTANNITPSQNRSSPINVHRFMSSNSSLPTASNFPPAATTSHHNYHNTSRYHIKNPSSSSFTSLNNSSSNNDSTSKNYNNNDSYTVPDYARLGRQNGYPLLSEHQLQDYAGLSTGSKIPLFYDDAESSDSSCYSRQTDNQHEPPSVPRYLPEMYPANDYVGSTSMGAQFMDPFADGLDEFSRAGTPNTTIMTSNNQPVRILPLMTTIAAGANYFNTPVPNQICQNHPQQQHSDLSLPDQQSVSHLGASQPAPSRSLPPMSIINGCSQQQAGYHQPRLSLEDYSQRSIPSSSSHSVNDHIILPEPKPMRRKLPLITPYGPQPINLPQSKHRQPLKPIQDTMKNIHEYTPRALQTASSRHPTAIRVENPPHDLTAAPAIELLQTAAVQYLSKKMGAQNQNSSFDDVASLDSRENCRPPPPPSRQNLSTSSKRGITDGPVNSAISSPARKLPIITDQGVLKLRNGATINSHEVNRRVIDANMLRRVSTDHGPLVNQHPPEPIFAEKKRDSLRESISLTDKQKYSSDIDYGEDIADEEVSSHDASDDIEAKELVLSDENSFVESEVDKIITASKSEDLNAAEDSGGINDEIGAYSEVRSSENQDDIFDYPALQDDNDNDKDDGIIIDEQGYYDPQSGHVQTEEEAEYYSALATVPEEEGKFSDKDNSQDYDHQDDIDASHTNNYAATDISANLSRDQHVPVNYATEKQLPTIVESSGFEAQVLEYIAGKTSMGRGQLFCVDEEPSSCNEDTEPRESPGSPKTGYLQQAIPEIREDLDDSTMKIEAYQPNDDNQQDPFNQSAHLEQIQQLQNYNYKLDSQNADCSIQQQLQFQPQNMHIAGPMYHEGEIESSNFQSVNEQIIDSNDGQYQSDPVQSETDDRQPLPIQNIVEEHRMVEVNVPTLTVSDATQEPTIACNDHYDKYRQQEQKMDSYDSEKDEDGRILMSNMSGNKNEIGLEQDDCDEQYRDINNLDDLDRRATNHVHAIDGHSKSMLNDIHQQRTIVDYDEGEYAMGNYEHFDEGHGTDHDDNLRDKDAHETEGGYDPESVDADEQVHGLDGMGHEDPKLDDSDYQFDSNIVNLTPEVADQREGASSAENEDYNGSDLPRARMRWIHAVNKIVSRSCEVSFTFQFLFKISVPYFFCGISETSGFVANNRRLYVDV